MNLRRDSGAVLPTVLVFSVFALIVAAIYTAGQYTTAKPALTGPSTFQALCNARSGIWKGLELLSKPPADSLAHINTLDSMFNRNLLGNQVGIAADSASGLVPGDNPTVVQPYGTDSFGTAQLSLTLEPCYKVLVSQGDFRNTSKTVRGLLAGAVYSSPDTVCFLQTGGKPEGGLIEGKISAAASQLPPLPPQKGTFQAPEQFRKGDVSRLVAYFRALLSSKTDTTLPGIPLTVQTSDKCSAIPEVINGSLFLNSTMASVVWKEKRRVFVLGDIQITGNTVVENVEFVTSGEVKCFDQCALRNVSVFTTKRLVLGDGASFSGNALALSSVLVYKDARIENRSIIVSYGESRGLAGDSAKQKKPQLPLSVFLRQNATVDGIIVACGTPGGIATDKNVVVKGALWASGAVVHQGSLYGILRANQITDMATIKAIMQQTPGMPPVVIKNSLTGSIHPLPSIADYLWPFFMGRLRIARWEEG